MPHTTPLVIAAVAAVIAHGHALAQPAGAHRRTPDADPTKDWPKPALRPGLSDAEIGAAIADHAKQLADAGHFSGVVIAAKAGKPIVARAYGLADTAAKTPNTVDTRFNIGSINKLFTKLAIAQLAQAGKLSLDDTLRARLPELAVPSADKITLRQLVDHRSGMGDIFGPAYDAAPPARLRELADFVPLFVGEPLAFEPGTSERYSNAGYIVLGLVIERLTGEKYRDYVARHIFAPAKMTSTGLWALDERVPRATGYTRHGKDRELDTPVPNTDRLPGRPSSAGGAFSTAGDLLQFWNAVLADKLASPRWTNWVVNGSLDDASRSPAIGVAGGAPGINTAIELAGGWIVVAMANLDPPSARAVAAGAMDIIRGRPAPDRPDGPVRRPPSAPATTELTRDTAVPATLAGHLFTVEAKLEGKGPFRFVVDSGAAGMLRITPALQSQLNLPQIGEARSGDPSGKNVVTRPVVRAGTVELGGARFTGVDAIVGAQLGGEQVDGVIGLALFASLTATLDYRKPELRLSRTPLADTPHTIAFTAERGIPVIDIDVAGRAMKVDVDTGSPALLTLPTAMAAPLTLTGTPTVHKGRTTSNEFEIKTSTLRGELRIAGFTQPQPAIDVVDIFPVGNLGSQFLRNYAVTFDMANRRLSLAR